MWKMVIQVLRIGPKLRHEQEIDRKNEGNGNG
jgi:hypothetical protein